MFIVRLTLGTYYVPGIVPGSLTGHTQHPGIRVKKKKNPPCSMSPSSRGGTWSRRLFRWGAVVVLALG